MITPKDSQVSQGILALDADFGAMAVRVATETWSIKELDPQDCALLCIVNDVCNQTLGMPFQMHVQLMITNGARLRQVKEILLHLAPHGVITFFRTYFPAKACQDENKPKLFPLSQKGSLLVS